MDSNRLMLIINPISGTRSKAGLDVTLERELRKYGFDVTVCFTAGPGHATSIARDAVAAGYGGVLACGGDGTVNEVARAMIGTGVPMGIIPCGSGNGLARHIGIPVDPLESVAVIGERYVRDCDYGTVNGQPFFCTFGIGFDAAVSDRFAASGQRGFMSYVKSAFQEFQAYQPEHYRISADGYEVAEDAFLAAVANANQYGNNAYIAPGASITDGLLDLVVIRRMPKAKTLLFGIDLMAGTIHDGPKALYMKANHVVIERAQNGPAHRDGEPFANAGERIDIMCHPHELRMFVTATKRPFHPWSTPFDAFTTDLTRSFRHLLHI